MHQKISLLFALIEFEKYGREYMEKMVHSANYIGSKLRDYGFTISDIHGRISETHQVHILTSKELMDTIYENASKCKITLNKKHKNLFHGYGIRLGTQEIARYAWDDEALDIIALCIKKISEKDVNIDEVKGLISELPSKEIHYAFPEKVISMFAKFE
jgi:glycine/serine hydroxymethyltransferase